MANYQKARVKLTNTQLSKLNSAAKKKTRTMLRLNKKNVEDEEFPHVLILTTRETTEIRNAFANAFVSILCRFISATSNFFSSKTYKWNRS